MRRVFWTMLLLISIGSMLVWAADLKGELRLGFVALPTEWLTLAIPSSFDLGATLNVEYYDGGRSFASSLTMTQVGVECVFTSLGREFPPLGILGELIWATPYVACVPFAPPLPMAYSLGGSPLGDLMFAKSRLSVGVSIAEVTVRGLAIFEDVNFPKPTNSLRDLMYDPGPDEDWVYLDPYDSQNFHVGTVIEVDWISASGIKTISRTGIGALWLNDTIYLLNYYLDPTTSLGTNPAVNELRRWWWLQRVCSDPSIGLLQAEIGFEEIPFMLGGVLNSYTLIGGGESKPIGQYVNLEWYPLQPVHLGIWYRLATPSFKSWCFLEWGSTTFIWADARADFILTEADFFRLSTTLAIQPASVSLTIDLRPCIGLYSLLELDLPVYNRCVPGSLALDVYSAYAGNGKMVVDELSLSWSGTVNCWSDLRVESHWTRFLLDYLVVSAAMVF